jgi:hypothetical protein
VVKHDRARAGRALIEGEDVWHVGDCIGDSDGQGSGRPDVRGPSGSSDFRPSGLPALGTSSRPSTSKDVACLRQGPSCVVRCDF